MHSEGFDFFLADPEIPKNLGQLAKRVMHVVKGPISKVGTHYTCVEAPAGELGFAVMSESQSSPSRVRCRAPEFGQVQSFSEMIKGCQLEDALVVFTSLQCLGGGLDR